MRYASSAICTCRALRSHSESTATGLIPSSRQPRITRMAISPRLAMRTLRNMEASSQRDIPMLLRRIAVPFVLQHVEGADQPATGFFGVDHLIDVPQGS